MVKKSLEIRERYVPRIVLESWRDLIEAIPYMNEAELLSALKEEASRPVKERRTDFIERLHRKYTKVRQERELQEYLT